MQERSVYQEIADTGLSVIGAKLVVLARFDPESLDVHFAAWSGLDSEPLRKVLAAATSLIPGFDPTRLSVKANANRCSRAAYIEGKVVSATLLEMGEGIVDSRLLRLAGSTAQIGYSYLCPLKVGNRVEGSISFHTSEALIETQQRAAEALARQASLALENAHLVVAVRDQFEELRRSRLQIIAADERLRREIAELLHGRVQTRLLVAWYKLGECESLLDTEPDKARTLLAQVREEIDEIREQEVRQASHLLHPSIIGVGLVPAIRSLSGRFEGYFPISVKVDPHLADLDGPVQNRIPEPLRLTAYRVVEEALTNVYRHAMANAVAVSLAVDDQRRLAIVVEDSGRGFNTARIKPGLGLSSIAGRVDQAGGTWQISSTLGRGTRLAVLLPLGANL